MNEACSRIIDKFFLNFMVKFYSISFGFNGIISCPGSVSAGAESGSFDWKLNFAKFAMDV
jgi:hypothetical protein